VALVLVVVVLAPLGGWVLDVALFSRLRNAGEVVKIVATIGLLVAIQGLAGLAWGAATTLTPTSIFSQRVFALGGFRASVEQLSSVGLTVVLALSLMAFLRFTSLGVRMRAVVDRPEVAELSGVDAARVSHIAWGIGTSFAALGGILLAPFFGSLDPITLTFLVIAATAAAVAGRLESFPLTLAGGYGIGIAQLVVQSYMNNEISRQVQPAIPFLVLFGLLFLPQWKRRGGEKWTPPPLPSVARLSRRDAATRVGIVGAIALVAPFVVGQAWQLQLARVPGMALIFLSLVVVCGFGGQVSLCQAALAGIGAFVAAHLIVAGTPFWIAVIVAGLSVVPIGVFLALRAADLSPLFLGFATLAFGAVIDEVLFSSQVFSGGLAGIPFTHPHYLTSPRVYYLAVLACFAAASLLVHNLRRSQTGLALAAMRDSELGLGSLGVDVARLRLTVFSISALIAGIGGALLSATDNLATPYTYFKLQSLIFLALAVVGGIGTWLGAFAGAVILQLLPAFVHEPIVSSNVVAHLLFRDQLDALLPVFFGLAAIGLARNPHGIADSIRRLFTPRPAKIVVPAPSLRVVDASLVTFPQATLYHRADCVLARGKEPVPVGETATLRPCPICTPTS
jgi:branched-chain amino acid transport system permease protein